MGLALLAAAVLMTLSALNRMPGGGDALALTGTKLVIACAITFVLGALMTLGIGAYAPIMIMVSLLGMNPTAAFPIMMGACAFLMPTASAQFIRKQRYDLRASIGLTLGGVPGVLAAFYIFRSLPVTAVRWLVVVVVIYTSITLLRASATERSDTKRSDFPRRSVLTYPTHLPHLAHPPLSMRHGVHEDVHAERIAIGRELAEVVRILALAFP
jgi:hypothetical protein